MDGGVMPTAEGRGARSDVLCCAQSRLNSTYFLADSLVTAIVTECLPRAAHHASNRGELCFPNTIGDHLACVGGVNAVIHRVRRIPSSMQI